jgi:hypothetical protein
VRPTDENQAGSTRPNLMSSRRAVGEDNILAMLERDSARRSGVRVSTVRLAWYGAAAAFAGILAGGVAWLAYDNHRAADELQAVRDAGLAAVAPAASGAGAPPQPPLPAPPLPIAGSSRAAIIVDESPPPTRVASAVPPLVMLPPQEGGTKRVPAQAPPQVAKKSSVAPRVMLPPREAAPASRGAAPARARSAPGAARSGADRKADKPLRTAARSAKAAPQRSPARPAPEAARQRKSAGGALQVDSDVALISAIIAQSERHRGEHEDKACSGADCPARPAHP